MNYTELIEISKSRDEDGAKIWKFEKITCHRNLKYDDW